MRRFGTRITAVCLALLLPVGGAAGGDRPGAFDYYVLALSWSPTWCALEGRARGAAQCDRPLGWILHGLWPQHERGWPADCPTSASPPSRAATAEMSDIMGSSGLAWHQWKKHGTCSGLSATDYFAASRAAWNRISRPAAFRELADDVTLPAALVEAAFLKENPALSADGVTVTCRSDRIQEVRICLTRDLEPRECGADTRRDCTARSALLEAVR
jgi:ribonuclease T2